jgi:hypothetical protein
VRQGVEAANAHQPLQRAADLAHKRLDEAVFAAYGWDPGLSDEALLVKLLELNLQRARA